MEYLVFILVAFASSLVSAVFGLGTALLLLSIGTLILPIKLTIALATILFLASGLAKSFIFRNKIDWRRTAWVTLGSVPFAYVGAGLLDAAPAELLQKMLGVMVLCYLLVTTFGGSIKLNPGTSGILAGSCLYGFLSGLLGSGNIVKAILFREMSLSKQSFVGIMAATSVLTNIAKLSVYARDGQITADLGYTILALVVCAIVSALIGRRLLQKISNAYFQHGLSIVLACIAIRLLV